MLQFIATSAVMLNGNQYTLLLSAFPVQIAAFLMTCVRKGIMTSKGWHIWYLLSFTVAMSSIVSVFDLILNLCYASLLYSIRHFGRVDKYKLWGPVAAFVPLFINSPGSDIFSQPPNSVLTPQVM